MWAFSSPRRASSSARYRPSSFWWAVVGTVSDVSLEVVSKETYFKKRSVTCMVVPPVSGIPQDTGILCLVLYHSFGKIRNFFRRRGRFFCGGGDFCLSNGGGCAILVTVCGRGGIGRLDGFRFHCHTACGFESRRPHQKPAGATGGLPVFYARVRGQGGSSHKWQLRCKCADPSAVFQQHAALFLHIRSTPFG